MQLDSLCRLYFPTHQTSVQINTVTDRVYVFKHNDQDCDYELFDTFEEAQEFIQKSL